MDTFLSLLFAEDMVHGLDVAVGKVHDVHVVPVPGPVPGVVIVSVHRDLLPPPDSHLVKENYKEGETGFSMKTATWAM